MWHGYARSRPRGAADWHRRAVAPEIEGEGEGKAEEERST